MKTALTRRGRACPTRLCHSMTNLLYFTDVIKEIMMFFSVGVETPKDENTAYGMIVPAFSAYDYGCFSAADTQGEIAEMVRDAVLLTVEDMVLSGKFSVEQLTDAGYLTYSRDREYADYDSWFVIDVDLSRFEGKPAD